MRKPKMWARLAALGAAVVLTAATQLVKPLVPQGAAVLVPGVLGLQYTQNYGISFSLLGDSAAAMRAVSAITGLAILVGIALLLMGKLRGAYIPGAALVMAGGAGNLIDRMLHGYVVDYIELLFVRFAIFNLADVLITCGVVWLAVWVLIGEPRGRGAVQRT